MKYFGASLQGNEARKFLKSVVAEDLEKKLVLPESLSVLKLEDVIRSLNDIVHLSFGIKKMDGIERAVDDFVRAWVYSGLGIGPKVHIIQYHLVPFLNNLEDDEGLGIWSEHAGESAHSAFAGVVSRYSKDVEREMLKHAVIEYNYTRM